MPCPRFPARAAPAPLSPCSVKMHSAPWSRSLQVVSALTTLACLAGSAALWRSPLPVASGWLPLALLAGAALFSVRGYAITAEALLIQRLGWTTRIPLADLRSASISPHAMRGSLRLCGNGGLFAFSGLFRHKTLGCYRAWVTDPQRSVVLRFAGRTVVVSPADPAAFIQDLPRP